jgi:hypothetical protein
VVEYSVHSETVLTSHFGLIWNSMRHGETEVSGLRQSRRTAILRELNLGVASVTTDHATGRNISNSSSTRSYLTGLGHEEPTQSGPSAVTVRVRRGWVARASASVRNC